MENKNDNHRVIGEKQEISYDKVKLFFNDRAGSKKKHIYNYVMYLDDKPEIAIDRDTKEKRMMDTLIDITYGMRVLDVGCGIGRWGEFFLKKGAFYVGMDVTTGMIEMAEKNLQEYKNKKLLVSAAQNLEETLVQADESAFDIIFVSGVLMYLNDVDCQTTMQQMASVCADGGVIFINESMSDNSRLTLNDFYSRDLRQDYSAIYRTVSEYEKFMDVAFGSNFIKKFGQVWNFEDGLQKKREHVTLEHLYMWEKIR